MTYVLKSDDRIITQSVDDCTELILLITELIIFCLNIPWQN